LPLPKLKLKGTEMKCTSTSYSNSRGERQQGRRTSNSVLRQCTNHQRSVSDADENAVLENCLHYVSHVRQLLHLCPTDADENAVLENCLHYVSHDRQLLHLQVQRRRVAPRKKLFFSALPAVILPTTRPATRTTPVMIFDE
jgi:hypothetical protein